jgi:hypothetical protein
MLSLSIGLSSSHNDIPHCLSEGKYFLMLQDLLSLTASLKRIKFGYDDFENTPASKRRKQPKEPKPKRNAKSETKKTLPEVKPLEGEGKPGGGAGAGDDASVSSSASSSSSSSSSKSKSKSSSSGSDNSDPILSGVDDDPPDSDDDSKAGPIKPSKAVGSKDHKKHVPKLAKVVKAKPPRKGVSRWDAGGYWSLNRKSDSTIQLICKHPWLLILLY